MSVANETEFGVGKWYTADGREAMVDAVADGLLIGRVNLRDNRHDKDLWYATIWKLDGRDHIAPGGSDLRRNPVPRVRQVYWVNIYRSGPGQLRKTWEESLVEASQRESEDVLCRVEVSIDAMVGEGLR
jgi:hypothetical protein